MPRPGLDLMGDAGVLSVPDTPSTPDSRAAVGRASRTTASTRISRRPRTISCARDPPPLGAAGQVGRRGSGRGDIRVHGISSAQGRPADRRGDTSRGACLGRQTWLRSQRCCAQPARPSDAHPRSLAGRPGRPGPRPAGCRLRGVCGRSGICRLHDDRPARPSAGATGAPGLRRASRRRHRAGVVRQ